MYTHMSSTGDLGPVGLGLVFGVFAFVYFLTLTSLFLMWLVFVFLCIIRFLFGCQHQRNRLTGKTRL